MSDRRDPQLDLWQDVVAEAFEEYGINASNDQLRSVAKDVQGAHENWDMAFPVPQGPHPLEDENARLKKLLKAEQEMVTCKQCRGTGGENTGWGITDCWKCRGRGRHAP